MVRRTTEHAAEPCDVTQFCACSAKQGGTSSGGDANEGRWVCSEEAGGNGVAGRSGRYDVDLSKEDEGYSTI